MSKDAAACTTHDELRVFKAADYRRRSVGGTDKQIESLFRRAISEGYSEGLADALAEIAAELLEPDLSVSAAMALDRVRVRLRGAAPKEVK